GHAHHRQLRLDQRRRRLRRPQRRVLSVEVSVHGSRETMVYYPRFVYEGMAPYRFSVPRQQTSSGRRSGVTVRISRSRRFSFSVKTTKKRPARNSSTGFSHSSGQHYGSSRSRVGVDNRVGPTRGSARPEGGNSCNHFSAFEGQHFGEGDRLQRKLDSSNLVEQTLWSR